MSALEWSLLFLALSALAFVFVLTLVMAGAAEDRRREQYLRTRYVDRRQP